MHDKLLVGHHHWLPCVLTLYRIRIKLCTRTYGPILPLTRRQFHTPPHNLNSNTKQEIYFPRNIYISVLEVYPDTFGFQGLISSHWCYTSPSPFCQRCHLVCVFVHKVSMWSLSTFCFKKNVTSATLHLTCGCLMLGKNIVSVFVVVKGNFR